MRALEGPTFAWKGKLPTTTTTAEALVTSRAMRMSTAVETNEILLGENNLRPVSFLELGLRTSKAVAQMVIPGTGVGSGFLVGVNLFLTNHHVLSSLEQAGSALVRFNYELDIDGELLSSTYFRCSPDVFFLTDEALDFTLVAVAGDPGIRFGYIPMTRATVAVGQRLNIIQHPAGGPKEIALVDNQAAYVDSNVIQYLTDTLPGSSGSPVFDDTWRLVALHHSGGWIPEPYSGSTHFRNEGIAINAIIDHLARAGYAS